MKKNNQPYNFLYSFKKILNIDENRKWFLDHSKEMCSPYLKDEDQVNTMKQFCDKMKKTNLFSDEEKSFFDKSIETLKKKISKLKTKRIITRIFLNVLVFGAIISFIPSIPEKDFNQIAFDENIKLRIGDEEKISKHNYSVFDKKIIDLGKLYHQKTQLVYKDFVLKNSKLKEYKEKCGKRYSGIFNTFGRDCRMLEETMDGNTNILFNGVISNQQPTKTKVSITEKVKGIGYIVSKYITFPFLFFDNLEYAIANFALLLGLCMLGLFLVWKFDKIVFCTNDSKKIMLFGNLMQNILDIFKQKMEDKSISYQIKKLLNIEKEIENLKKQYNHHLNIKSNLSFDSGLQKELEKHQKEIKEIEKFLQEHNITGDLFEIVKIMIQEYGGDKVYPDYLKGKYYDVFSHFNNYIVFCLFVIFIIFFNPLKHNELNHRIMEHKITQMIKDNDSTINQINKPYLMFMLNYKNKSFAEKQYLVTQMLNEKKDFIQPSILEEENQAFKHIEGIKEINNKIINIISEQQ